jgi:hypothetical protein
MATNKKKVEPTEFNKLQMKDTANTQKKREKCSIKKFSI